MNIIKVFFQEKAASLPPIQPGGAVTQGFVYLAAMLERKEITQELHDELYRKYYIKQTKHKTQTNKTQINKNTNRRNTNSNRQKAN